MSKWMDNPASHWMQGAPFEMWAAEMDLPITNAPPELVWVDLETTGLEAHTNVTLEMGIVLTDRVGRVCRDGAIDWRIWRHRMWNDKSYEVEFAHMDPFVQEMHEASGLMKDIVDLRRWPHEMSDMAEPEAIQNQAIDWLNVRTPDGVKFPLSGSSAHFDRSFIAYDMPRLNKWFHYRVGVDVSAYRELAKLTAPHVVDSQPKALKKHRPLPDLADSIRLYRHLLRNFFRLDGETWEMLQP